MRFMILIKATKASEAGVMPDERLLTEMGNFNEELMKAGVMLAGEGLIRPPRARGSDSAAASATSSTGLLRKPKS